LSALLLLLLLLLFITVFIFSEPYIIDCILHCYMCFCCFLILVNRFASHIACLIWES